MIGPDYTPPEYIRREHQAARQHRWYMTSRLITINDIYSTRTSWSNSTSSGT